MSACHAPTLNLLVDAATPYCLDLLDLPLLSCTVLCVHGVLFCTNNPTRARCHFDSLPSRYGTKPCNERIDNLTIYAPLGFKQRIRLPARSAFGAAPGDLFCKVYRTQTHNQIAIQKNDPAQQASPLCNLPSACPFYLDSHSCTNKRSPRRWYRSTTRA